MKINPDLNSISKNKDFIKTVLYKRFAGAPIGFIDIGSAGGVHPLIMPVASLTHCMCFEPDEAAYEEIKAKHRKNSPFSRITVLNAAVSDRSCARNIYLTRSRVNSSLLKPSREMAGRYHASGFKVERISSVRTRSLDQLISASADKNNFSGEFIKIDSQGAEYDILKGAQRILDDHCMSVYLELEFFKLYEGQKLFSEVDMYLRAKGFQLYGIYPHYISAKQLDRREYDSQERIAWADALYFKDPLADKSQEATLSRRNIDVLLLTAILAGFYAFALEISGRYYKKGGENGHIEKLILNLAARGKKRIEEEARVLAGKIRKDPKHSYLLARKFIDSHKNNSDLDFIKIPNKYERRKT